jgi:hypothetical protein
VGGPHTGRELRLVGGENIQASKNQVSFDIDKKIHHSYLSYNKYTLDEIFLAF